MIRFAGLFASIDRTTSTNSKVDAMAAYFSEAPPADAAWAVFFLTGRRLKRLVPGARIWEWTLAATGFEAWVLEECYAVVGDGAETAALVFDVAHDASTRDAAATGDDAPSRGGEASAPFPSGGASAPFPSGGASAPFPSGRASAPFRGGEASAPFRSGGASAPPSGRTATEPVSLATWIEDRILPLKQLDPATQQSRVTAWLLDLDRSPRFILLKLLTGQLRLGVSQTLVVRALANAAGLPVTTIAARLMGDWTPSAEWMTSLMALGETAEDRSRPYPFYLASPLEKHDGHEGKHEEHEEKHEEKHEEHEETQEGHELQQVLGDLSDWQVEWKWDGIRAQLIVRGGTVHLWSRGEELITHRFPEVTAAATRLPDGTVLDGEVLAFRDDRPLPFSALQQRIGRQKLVAQMARSVPVVFMTYDILELDGRDVRSEPLSWRRAALEQILLTCSGGALALPAAGVLRTSARVEVTTWEELALLRAESRARAALKASC